MNLKFTPPSMTLILSVNSVANCNSDVNTALTNRVASSYHQETDDASAASKSQANQSKFKDHADGSVVGKERSLKPDVGVLGRGRGNGLFANRRRSTSNDPMTLDNQSKLKDHADGSVVDKGRSLKPDVGVLGRGKTGRAGNGLLANRHRSTSNDPRLLQNSPELCAVVQPACEPNLCSCIANYGQIADCAPEVQAVCNGVTGADGTSFTLGGCGLGGYESMFCSLAECIINGGTYESCYATGVCESSYSTCEPNLCGCMFTDSDTETIVMDCAPEMHAVCNGVTGADGTNFNLGGCFPDEMGDIEFYESVYCSLAECFVNGGTNATCYCAVYEDMCEGLNEPFDCAIDACCKTKVDDEGRGMCLEDAGNSGVSMMPSASPKTGYGDGNACPYPSCEPNLCSCIANNYSETMIVDCAPELHAVCNGVTGADGTNFNLGGCLDPAGEVDDIEFYQSVYCSLAECFVNGGTNETCYCALYEDDCEGNNDPISCAIDACCKTKVDDEGRGMCLEDAGNSGVSMMPSASPKTGKTKTARPTTMYVPNTISSGPTVSEATGSPTTSMTSRLTTEPTVSPTAGAPTVAPKPTSAPTEASTPPPTGTLPASTPPTLDDEDSSSPPSTPAAPDDPPSSGACSMVPGILGATTYFVAATFVWSLGLN